MMCVHVLCTLYSLRYRIVQSWLVSLCHLWNMVFFSDRATETKQIQKWKRRSGRRRRSRIKNNNTNPHPKQTIYRCYCCSVDTFRWARLHFIFALNLILIFHTFLRWSSSSHSLSISFPFAFSIAKKKKKKSKNSYCFARVHRLTEHHHHHQPSKYKRNWK